MYNKSRLDDAGKEKAKALWRTGYTAAHIAVELNKAYSNITRRLVMGVVYRAREVGDETLACRVVRIEGKRVVKPRLKTAKPKPVPLPIESPQFIGPKNDFPAIGHCRYTPDDPQKDYQMCGQPTGDYHDPWCEWHKRNTIYPKPAVAV